MLTYLLCDGTEVPDVPLLNPLLFWGVPLKPVNKSFAIGVGLYGTTSTDLLLCAPKAEPTNTRTTYCTVVIDIMIAQLRHLFFENPAMIRIYSQ